MSAFADKQIKCMECNKDFTYTAAEQELHKSLGYQNEPKRCNPCREAKRQRRPGGGRDRAAAAPANGAAPVEGAPAAAPGVPAAAPPPRPPQQQARPQGNRPPQQQNQRGGGPPQGRRDGGRGNQPRPPQQQQQQRENRGGPGPGADPGFAPREFFLAICAECGKEAQLPFKPQGDRPVLCIDCFAQKRTG